MIYLSFDGVVANSYKQKRSVIKSGNLFFSCVFLALCFYQAHAQPAQSKEQEIKAAFLYKFGSYVEWPDTSFIASDSPLIISVLGAEGLADKLEEIISGRTVNGRPVEVHRISPGTSITNSHILFVGRSENLNLAYILEEVRQLPVLTVTESEESLSQEGIINFVITEDKVRFDISLGIADRSNLKISARLLQVARKIITGTS